MKIRMRQQRLGVAHTFLISLCVMAASVTTYAQPPREVRFVVVVTRQLGAPVPDARVSVRSESTGQSREASTDAQGRATFENLAPGAYSFTVVAGGVAPQTESGVVVTEATEQEVEWRLGLGIRPLATAPTVDAVDVGGEVPAQEVSEDPQANLAAITNPNNDLTPVLQVASGAVATGPSALGRVVVDGKGKEQQTVWFDRIDATPLIEVPTPDSSLDVVGAFLKPEVAYDFGSKTKTRIVDYTPFYGPGVGTVVDGVTYQGSKNYLEPSVSDWKFQLYGEHRNEALAARNFFDAGGKSAPRRSRFGGRAGGPFFSDRSYAYVAYEGTRGRLEREVFEAVPADAACVTCGGGVAQLLRGFLPRGTEVLPGVSQNPDFLAARRRVRTAADANAWAARLDHYPHQGHANAAKAGTAFTLRFIRQAADNFVPEGVTGRRQRQRIVFANALANYLLATEGETTHNFKFGINETRAHVDTELPPGSVPALAQSVLNVFGSVRAVGLPGGVPSVSVASLGGLSKAGGRGFKLTPVSFIAGYDFFGVAGRHEVRFGVETRFIRLGLDRLGGMTYTFPNASALRAGTPSTVTFLSDLSAQSPFGGGAGPRHARQEYYMGYFQMVTPVGRGEPDPTNSDKVEPRLRFVYGFRYDYFGPVRERDERAVVVDPLNGEVLPPSTPFYRTRKDNFQPRFGLSYRLSGHGFFRKTLLRAGVGLYSGTPRIGDLLLPIESDRFSTGLAGGTFPIAPAEVVRGFVEAPDTRQYQPLAFARDFTTPERAWKWDASLTQTLNGYNLTLLYTGNAGSGLPLANIANKIVSVSTNADPSLPAVVVREFDLVRDGQVFKPFGEFFYRLSDGRSSFNALTVQLSRNGKHKSSLGWLLTDAVGELDVKYTLARNVGNASGAVLSDPFNPDFDFGFNAADARHSFSLAAVFNLWNNKQRRPQDSLRYGWRIAPSLRASTGTPLIIRLDRPDVVYLDAAGSVFSTPAPGRRAVINTPGGGATGAARVPDLIPGVAPYSRRAADRLFLNTAAFAIPAPGQFGNLKRGRLRGPAAVQFDLSLTRTLFGSQETVQGDFRVDIINVFNRANFINPSAALPNALGASAADNQIQPGVPFSTLSSGAFGVLSAADTGRQIQVSFNFRLGGGFSK